MRIHLRTTPSEGEVAFNYQPKLVGILHKWLGENVMHGRLSLYSFSWLMNAQFTGRKLEYPYGARFFISFYEDEYLKQVVQAIMADPAMCYGMRVTDIEIEKEPDFTDRRVFKCASPIFVKRLEEDGHATHYTFEHEDAGIYLTETLLHKMEIAGLPKDETLRIRFDVSDPRARVKLIDYRGVKNKVSQCPVIIEGKAETRSFAWNVGVGNSTGVGFGAIH
jgi:CRISPR-associated endoribonuclease Cas6